MQKPGFSLPLSTDEIPCIGKTLDLVKAIYIGFHWASAVHLKILTLKKKILLK